jgi:hypothetical protein
MRQRRVRTIVATLGFLGIASALTLLIGDFSRWRRPSDPPRLSAPAPVRVGLEIPVSDEEWHKLIAKSRLDSPLSVSELLHEWRLLAAIKAAIDRLPPDKRSAQPDEARCREYEQMLGQGMCSEDKPGFKNSLFWHGPVGLCVRLKNRERGSEVDGEAHEGELLATLAECGVPAAHRIRVDGATFSVSDLVRQTAYDYDGKAVPEFLSVGLAYHLAPASGFQNRFGRFVRFDDLMHHLTASPLGDGTCHGTHVCYAISALLWIDSGRPFLSAECRERGRDYLVRAASRLAATQHRDGAWRLDWPADVSTAPPAEAEADWGDAVCATGHHLEWMALYLDPPLEPRRIDLAIGFLVSRLRDQDAARIRQTYNDWSHALRAITFWRGVARGRGETVSHHGTARATHAESTKRLRR